MIPCAINGIGNQGPINIKPGITTAEASSEPAKTLHLPKRPASQFTTG